jgi:spore coat protein H
LFAESNQLLSLQTNFVNLWIKDLNKNSQKFIDYGLFTQVEEVDENYFRKRNLDSNGHLYKAKIFEFREYPEAIKLEDSVDYSKDDFEYRLDIEGLESHDKLIKMLKDVNNPLLPINDVIKKHFNRENYITWLASNILLGNVDTASGNYYLYSPQESTTWYFIPWDYDKSLRAYTTDADWKEGLTNYWGSILHRRFLKNDNNREALTQKVDELYSTVYSSENISKLINAYEPILREAFSKEPDKKSEEEIDALIKALNETRKDIWENKIAYYDTLEKPMPFHLGTVVDQGEYVSINWEESYDFQGQSLTYELMISDQPTMDPILYQFDNLKDTEFILDDLPSGRYYYKVRVEDSEGLLQEPFDIYVDQKTGLYYYGIKTFYIE